MCFGNYIDSCSGPLSYQQIQVAAAKAAPMECPCDRDVLAVLVRNHRRFQMHGLWSLWICVEKAFLQEMATEENPKNQISISPNDLTA